MTSNETMRPNQVVLLDGAYDKPRLLRELAERAASATGLDRGVLLTALQRREDLGSTGLGGGIAIPHTRVPGLDRPHGILAILQRPVDFNAIDGHPVDIAYLLIAPDNTNMLKALAGATRTLHIPGAVARLRAAKSAQAAFDIFDP